MSQLQYTGNDVNIISLFLKTAIQTQQISEDAAKSAIDSLRKNLTGTVKPATAITIKEFCQRAKLSKPTVYKAINQGRIKIVKFGKSTRISEDQLDKILRGE